MTQALSIHYDVSADGRTVAEAEVDGIGAAQELIAAATVADCELAWAHSAADLSSLGFAGQPGYRRLTGQARPGPLPAGVTELAGREDTAELCAAAYQRPVGPQDPRHVAYRGVRREHGPWPAPRRAHRRHLPDRSGGRRRSTLRACSRASAIRPATGCSSPPRCRGSRRDG